MIDAAEELLQKLSDISKEVSDIKCLWIGYERYGTWDKELGKRIYGYEETFNLKIDWTEQDIQKLWHDLDFEYNDGYGDHELYGIVWFNDGTWLERWEYDGSEGWAYKRTPKIPDNLNQI